MRVCFGIFLDGIHFFFLEDLSKFILIIHKNIEIIYLLVKIDTRVDEKLKFKIDPLKKENYFSLS